MGAFPFIPLYGRDFRSDTEHLRAREVGAYMLLIMVAWEQPNCRLPDDDKLLAAWARVDPRAWATIKPAVMAFWVLKAGQWTQTRLRKEWDSANKRAAAARANGRRGGRKKVNQPNASNNPVGLPKEPNHETPAKLITSISTTTEIDNQSSGLDKKNTPARVVRFVSEDALNRVRGVAPGWDRQLLLQLFTDWPPSKDARNMDAAFLGWAKKYTKGQPPGSNVAHAQFTKWAAKE